MNGLSGLLSFTRDESTRMMYSSLRVYSLNFIVKLGCCMECSSQLPSGIFSQNPTPLTVRKTLGPDGSVTADLEAGVVITPLATSIPPIAVINAATPVNTPGIVVHKLGFSFIASKVYPESHKDLCLSTGQHTCKEDVPRRQQSGHNDVLTCCIGPYKCHEHSVLHVQPAASPALAATF